MKDLPKHKIILISGDINAKIDKANYKVSQKQLLVNITNGGNISDRNRRFCKRDGKLWTFTDPNGAKAQLVIDAETENGKVVP